MMIVRSIRTVMLSPRGRMLRLFPLKVVWRVWSLDPSWGEEAEGVGAPSTAEAAVQSVRRVWAKCILFDRSIDVDVGRGGYGRWYGVVVQDP